MKETFPKIAELISAMGDEYLTIFDTETTGLLHRPPVRIVELAAVRVDKKGEAECLMNTRMHPGMRIPFQASSVHGIYDRDVHGLPEFPVYAPKICEFFKGPVGGFNSASYDVPLVLIVCKSYGISPPELPRQIDVRKVHCTVAKSQKGRLTEVAVQYGVEPGTAHSAKGDVETTLRLLEYFVKEFGVDFVLKASLSKEKISVEKGDSLPPAPSQKFVGFDPFELNRRTEKTVGRGNER